MVRKKTWLCGCPIKNALFCFPCLLFEGSTGGQGGDLWSRGMSDLKHISERVKKHDNSRAHLDCCLKLAMLGRANIAIQLDEGYHASIRAHNKDVDHNRHILSKLIDCVKFCGAFELALRGHDEKEDSENPGIFRGLVDFVASLDTAMKEHLDTATVFKGTSKTIQNELLDCMYATMQGYIVNEIQSTDFVSVQADETTDVTTHCQLVIVLRYIDATNTVQERFFGFVKLSGSTNADNISKALLENLAPLFPAQIDKAKLIAQTYDGASVMRGSTGGVRKKIQDEYPNAHFLHCYAHQLNLVMQKAASAVTMARVFFADLGGFSAFFSRSPKRTDVLDSTVARRLPCASSTRWNFHSRAVNTVHENRDALLECFETIQASDEFDNITIREAKGFSRMLKDKDFLFFLDLFHQIMPHSDILFAHLQKRSIDAVQAQTAVKRFMDATSKARDSVPTLCARHYNTATEGTTRRGNDEAGDKQRQAYEVSIY